MSTPGGLPQLANLGVGVLQIFFISLYLCQFNFDFYETLYLRSLGPWLSSPCCLPKMATLGVGQFKIFHYIPLSQPIKL